MADDRTSHPHQPVAAAGLDGVVPDMPAAFFAPSLLNPFPGPGGPKGARPGSGGFSEVEAAFTGVRWAADDDYKAMTLKRAVRESVEASRQA